MFDAGALLLVPFPFSDLSSTKRRPVLALTPPDPNGDFIACPITSRDRWTHARRVLPTDMIEGVLPLPSWVRTDHVVTLHVALVVRTFGRTSDAFRSGIADALCAFMRAPAADAA